jgi:hypothetical protein
MMAWVKRVTYYIHMTDYSDIIQVVCSSNFTTVMSVG